MCSSCASHTGRLRSGWNAAPDHANRSLDSAAIALRRWPATPGRIGGQDRRNGKESWSGEDRRLGCGSSRMREPVSAVPLSQRRDRGVRGPDPAVHARDRGWNPMRRSIGFGQVGEAELLCRGSDPGAEPSPIEVREWRSGSRRAVFPAPLSRTHLRNPGPSQAALVGRDQGVASEAYQSLFRASATQRSARQGDLATGVGF